MTGSQRGYTLTELLVALLVIAVLGSLAVSHLLGARAAAEDRRAMTAAETAQRAIQAHRERAGTYATSPRRLAALDPSLRSARDLRVDGDRRTYVVSAASGAGARGGGRFAVERDRGGRITRRCERPGRGACAAGGRW